MKKSEFFELVREHAGETVPTFSLFSGEAWSDFSEYVSSQNNVSNVNPLPALT
jgi:hypothetical protein